MSLSRTESRTVARLFAIVALAVGLLPAASFAKKAPEPSRIERIHPENRAFERVGNRRIDATSGETLAWYRINEPLGTTDAEAGAIDFLKRHAEYFGGDAVNDLRYLKTKHSKAARHVHLQQTFQGIPVWRAIFNVGINSRNEITMITANPFADFQLASTTPVTDGLKAVQDTRTLLNATSSMMEHPLVRLQGFRDASGSDHLAWVVNYPSEQPIGDWLVIWDAETGEHLATYDQMQFDDGTGMAFIPDPLTSAGVNYNTTGFTDGNDADTEQLNGERESVTLHDLTQSGGVWHLTGPYCTINDFESPTSAPVTSTTLDGFDFTRSEQGFEDVNTYFNIDNWQRKIQSLGFTDIQNTSINVDPHGFSGQDNSHYIPSTNRLAFGEGGVDDAEDADVVLHEYGHALHFDAASGGAFSNDMSGISEGTGDYDAVTYSARLYDFHNTWVFNWDGHNTFWGGRLITTNNSYPNQWNGADIYTKGTIWANALWLMRQDLDPDTADCIFFEGMFNQNASGNVIDAAEGLLQAELDLFNGRHRAAVYGALAAKGFVTPAGDLDGTVTDVLSDQPIEGAEVTLEGSSANPVMTDADGHYLFSTIEADDYVLTVTADGYAAHSENVSVVSGTTTTVDVQMGTVSGTVDPSEMSLELYVGSTLDTSFTLSNEGGPLDWAASSRPVGVDPIEPFEPFGMVNAEEIANDDRLQGVTIFDGKFVVSGGNGQANPNRIYVFDSEGELLNQFNQVTNSVDGFYDLTSDGTLIYGSEDENIVGFGLDGVPVDTIPGPFSPNRALAYDPDRDWFWCADNSTGLTAVDRSGEEQAHFTFSRLVKGIGYYPNAPGGNSLYVTSQGSGSAARISYINPETGIEAGYHDLESGSILGSEVGNQVTGASEYWFEVALVDNGFDGIGLGVYKLDWSLPYMSLSPRIGSLDPEASQEIAIHIDGDYITAGDHATEVFVEFLNGGGGTTVTVNIHATAVDAPETAVPEKFALEPAYPNPFNPSTVLTLHLPDRADVQVAVYDLLGRLVDRMDYRALSAGVHRMEWAAPAGLASGVYFLRVDAGAGHAATQKLVLMK